MSLSNIKLVTDKITRARTVTKIAGEKMTKRTRDLIDNLQGMVLRTYVPQQTNFAAHDKSIAQAVQTNALRNIDAAMLSMFDLLKTTIADEKKIAGNVAKAVARVTDASNLMRRMETEYLRTLSNIRSTVARLRVVKRNYFLSIQNLEHTDNIIPADQLYEMDIVMPVFEDDTDDEEQVAGDEDEDDEDDDEDGLFTEGHERPAKKPRYTDSSNMNKIRATADMQFKRNAHRQQTAAAAARNPDYGIFFHKKYNHGMTRIQAAIRRDGISAISIDDKKLLLEWFTLCTKNIDKKIANCTAHMTALRTRCSEFETLTTQFHQQLDECETLVNYQHRVHLVDTAPF